MPKRRANGEGNIRKRKDGRWAVSYTHLDVYKRQVELGVLAEKHIYLRLLYTRSFGCFSVNGYDQAEIQAIALDLKEFAKQFSETRKQVEKFLKCVLDVDSAGREPQKRERACYIIEGRST